MAMLHSPSPTFSASNSPSAPFHTPSRPYNASSCRSSTSSAASPRVFTPAAQAAPPSSRRIDASPSLVPTPPTSVQPARSPVLKRQTSDAATQYTPTDYPPTFRPTQGKRQSSSSADPSHQSRAKRRETFADTDTATTDGPQEPQPRETPQPATFSATIQQDAAAEALPQRQDAAPPPQPTPLNSNVKIMPVKYETCDVKDLGVLISDMLMELVRLNDGLPLQDGQLTRFHSRAPPSISVRDYLNRLIVHATLSPPILLSMVYYIDRLCLLYPAFTISSLTVHRFLIAAATVASKGLSDSFWTNNTYARVGGVSTRELALLELEFLTRLQWRIVPKPEVLVDYYRSLVERGDGYVMEHDAEAPE
ncbi:cyclin-domain-containing protein [Macrophomina phaseolina]|uniref:Cyclin-domain-containing protein n=1 Tax=Macrophomina phaseolina TaxID=35725 RepID=A0ABQ8G6X3_9PEZI|nr:cyclin-domain-containing protein [Macrophomina phaseolina]